MKYSAFEQFSFNAYFAYTFNTFHVNLAQDAYSEW